MLKKMEDIGKNVWTPVCRAKETERRDHSHVGQGDVVLKVTRKIRFDEPLGLREGLVSTSAEEGNAGEAEQRGKQGAVRHPSQTAHTAVIATCNPSTPQMQSCTFEHYVCSYLQLKMIGCGISS